MTPHEILGKAELLKAASGEKLRKEMRAGRQVVRSSGGPDGGSVRGVWDPFHGRTAFRV